MDGTGDVVQDQVRKRDVLMTRAGIDLELDGASIYLMEQAVGDGELPRKRSKRSLPGAENLATNRLSLPIGADGANSGSGGIRISDAEFEEIGPKNRGKVPSLRNAQEYSSQHG
jgi:hypothetical protein